MIVNGSRCYYCLSSASFSALLKLPLLLLLLSSSQIGYVVMANSSRTTGSSSNAVTDDASSGYNTIKTTTSPNNTNAIVRFYFIRHGESGANKWGLIAGQDDVPLTDHGIQEAKLLGQSSWIHNEKRRRRQNQKLNSNNNNNNNAQDNDVANLDDGGFWRVYSSDLSRAKDTAIHALQAGNQHHLVPILIEDHRLRERSYGLRQGFARSMPEEEILKVWEQYGRDPPPYETDEELWERGRDFILHVLEEVIQVQRLEEQTAVATGTTTATTTTRKVYHVLVAAHAGLIREILLNLISHDKLIELGAKFDPNRGNKLIIPNTSVSIIEIEATTNSRPFDFVKVVDLLNADHLEKVNVYDD